MLAMILAFPLAGFLLNGLLFSVSRRNGGKGPGATLSGSLASVAIGASFLVSLVAFIQLHGLPAEARVIDQHLFSWLSVGTFDVRMALRLDSLSGLYALFITGVGTLIHVYSIGYMSHDETPSRFFAYLNLFCLAMLILVLGSSLPVMFLGWEGVGLCSYLLIGYWYQDDEKASAGKKAFIVNRIGDLGFLLGMFLIFSTFGTLEFAGIQAAVAPGGVPALPAGVPVGTVTAICLLLFVGCAGKSAQIPLYIWLPDAMAGPTPVSALIHAATMVTSGIYLVARLSALFTLSPQAMEVVAVIGAGTAFFAATMAIAQDDIKKVLAYSTVSQLGYMFLGCGVGAFSAGVFHVVTHAFFKALMFLGAGSVIHALHEEQDITRMGGLRQKLPKTFLVFAAGWLAICGIPPFSGFFSKDEILWRAFSSPHGSVWLWAVGALTAVMTAIYMTRLFALTFLGSYRGDRKHPHESPTVMILPLQILAVLSVIGGFIGIPHASWIEHWLHLGGEGAHALRDGVQGSLEWLLMILSAGLAAGAMYYTIRFYEKNGAAEALRTRLAPLHRVLANKWYIDELFGAIVVRPIVHLAMALWKYVDVAVVDRLVLSFGRVSQSSGQAIRVVQTGSIQAYGILLLIGALAIVGYLIYGMA